MTKRSERPGVPVTADKWLQNWNDTHAPTWQEILQERTEHPMFTWGPEQEVDARRLYEQGKSRAFIARMDGFLLTAGHWVRMHPEDLERELAKLFDLIVVALRDKIVVIGFGSGISQSVIKDHWTTLRSGLVMLFNQNFDACLNWEAFRWHRLCGYSSAPELEPQDGTYPPDPLDEEIDKIVQMYTNWANSTLGGRGYTTWQDPRSNPLQDVRTWGQLMQQTSGQGGGAFYTTPQGTLQVQQSTNTNNVTWTMKGGTSGVRYAVGSGTA